MGRPIDKRMIAKLIEDKVVKTMRYSTVLKSSCAEILTSLELMTPIATFLLSNVKKVIYEADVKKTVRKKEVAKLHLLHTNFGSIEIRITGNILAV